jgi:dihydrofolate synthase/folylpolyglutamate synthase
MNHQPPSNNGGKGAYEAALEYLERATPRGSLQYKRNYAFERGIERTAYLLYLLGGGSCNDIYVVVAGTKGKGSTTAMISSILSAAGYRTGMFTGPHLHSCCERFQIDGRMIPEDRLATYVLEAQQTIESRWEEPSIGTPTKFEIETAVALKYFDDEEVDFAVLEVGIGGRHDAVNVVNPTVSVITNISLEHTALLGDSLEEIAFSKAGIIRPNSIVVSAPQPLEAEQVIEEVCTSLRARLVKVGVDWQFDPLRVESCDKRSGQYFRVFREAGPAPTELSSSLTGYPLFVPLLGAHQLENATVAIAAVAELETASVSVAQMEDGLNNVRWPGRLEILSVDPLVVVDGAHNPYSMQKLAEALRSVFRYDRLILVVGVSSDKDIPGMLRAICPLADELIVTQFNHPRSASAELLASFVPGGVPYPHIVRDVQSAISLAFDLAQHADLVCVTGSLYLVGEARGLFLQDATGSLPSRRP